MASVEEPHAKRLFEALDAAAEGRLREVQPLGGLPEVAVLREGHGMLELVQLDHEKNLSNLK